MSELPTFFVDRVLPDGLDTLFDGRAQLVGPDPDDLRSADAAIAGGEPWGAARMDGASPALAVISRAGIGYDAVDLVAATARGIVVCNAPEAPTVSTAEHAVTLLFMAAKRVSVSQQRLRLASGDYFAANDGLELEGRTLGLVAYGRIARRVGQACRALGMRVIAYDPYLAASEYSPDVELVELDDLLARADLISLHAPLTDETRHLFDAATFERTKPGVILVNTARGGLVDHDALLEALDDGSVHAAGLDVTEPEPLPPDHPLLHRDDVVVTPHIASSTDRGKRRLYEHAIANALAVISGDRPATVVNPEVYER
ncbi:MAG: hydroxyacid dehydrogenase [Acidimicrobiia bacterium]|nr:hydroxyacid dehydrogenase [Acidimicrobiia bacterium]